MIRQHWNPEAFITAVSRKMGADCEGDECTENFVIKLQIDGDHYSIRVKTKEAIGDLGYDVELFKNGELESIIRDCSEIIYPEHVRQRILEKEQELAEEKNESNQCRCSKSVGV